MVPSKGLAVPSLEGRPLPIPSLRPRWRGPWALGILFGAIQAALVLRISWGKLRAGIEDTDLYFRYASSMGNGTLPYRDFAVEYPPLALPLFLAPAALARDVGTFKILFAVEMLLINAVCVVLVARRVAHREGPARVAPRLAWYSAVVLIFSRLIVTRYDAAPMLVGFLAALAWDANRSVSGGSLASLGALMKVYPATIAIVGAVRDFRKARNVRGIAAFAVASAMGAGLWLVVGGIPGVLATARYHMGRGFEYGSLYSGFLMLAAKVLGHEIVISRDHASFSTITPWTGPVLRLAFPIQGAFLFLVAGIFARRGSNEMIRYSGAAVLAFIASGKVFSPQYLIWPIPFLAVLEGPVARRSRLLFLAICAMSLLAPSAFSALSRTHLVLILAFTARNLLVLGLLALMVFGPPGERGGPSSAVGA